MYTIMGSNSVQKNQYTGTDKAFTYGQIGPSHMVDQIVAPRGCAMRPANADGYFNHVRYGLFVDGACSKSCANLMASAHGKKI
jgi:hypothetical protein